jgi:hypothetical protein
MENSYLKLYPSAKGKIFAADIDNYYSDIKEKAQHVSTILSLAQNSQITYVILHVYHDNCHDIIESIDNSDSAHQKLPPSNVQFEAFSANSYYPTKTALDELDTRLNEKLNIDTSNTQYQPPDQSYDSWREYFLNSKDSIKVGKWKCIHENDEEIISIGEECSNGHTHTDAPNAKVSTEIFDITEYMR